VEPQFEFEHNGLRFTVDTEVQPDRGLHNLYYRGHFLRTEVTSRDATRTEITTKFLDWLADHPVSPYECHGGPLDGELMEDRGPLFIPSDVGTGRYRLRGGDYEWEQ
jgi:hypothetical protein